MSRTSRLLAKLKGPLPAWLLIVLIFAAVAAAAGAFVAFNILSPKQDFQMQPNPSSQKALTGNMVVFKINVSSLDGFSGIVSLSTNVPAGFSVSIVTATTGSPVVLLGTSGTATLAVSAGVAGNYTLTVVGTSGKLSHSISLPIVILGIGFTASPSPMVYPANSTITMTSLNGLAGNLSLSGEFGLFRVSVTPRSVYLLRSGTATVVVTLGGISDWIRGDSITFRASDNDPAFPAAGGGFQTIDYNLPFVVNESLTLASSTFTSSTSVTLNLQTNIDLSVASYSVADGAGDQYVLNYTTPSNCCFDSMKSLAVTIGASCPSCVLTGKAFTFTTGNSYTITIETARGNLFPFNVRR